MIIELSAAPDMHVTLLSATDHECNVLNPPRIQLKQLPRGSPVSATLCTYMRMQNLEEERAAVTQTRTVLGVLIEARGRVLP